MNTYCTDVDLLHWEPNLLKDAAFASQTLIAGTANLAGTTLTITSGSLSDAHVEANEVVVLSGSVAGSFPVVSVDSATVMTISVLYDKLFPFSDDDAVIPSPVGTASGLSYVVRTFWPQRRIVSELLDRASGIDPESADAPTVLNPQALKRACTLGTLQMIYNALAAASGAPESYKVRADMYENLYRRAMRSARVELDLNGDGVADCRRDLGVLQITIK
jgi:hypothetical protein